MRLGGWVGGWPPSSNWVTRTQRPAVLRSVRAAATRATNAESPAAEHINDEHDEDEAVPVADTGRVAATRGKPNSQNVSVAATGTTRPGRVLGITPPWGAVSSDAEQQLAELKEYESRRGTIAERRKSKKSATTLAEAARVAAELEAKVVKYDQNGQPTVDRTALGEGKFHTYAMAIYPGKEDRFMEFMQPKILSMGPVRNAETGEAMPRSVELFVPTKMIKAFSEKSLKWSNKSIKYKDGGWVFVRGILDAELLENLNTMIYFQNWRNVIRFKFSFMEEESELPVPCSAAELAEIEEWKLHKDEETEEMEKCVEYGGDVDMEIANRVTRRDQMEEDLDVDEDGNTIYRKDYSGTYNNPNNFYEGEATSGYNTGSGRAADRMGARQSKSNAWTEAPVTRKAAAPEVEAAATAIRSNSQGSSAQRSSGPRFGSDLSESVRSREFSSDRAGYQAAKPAVRRDDWDFDDWADTAEAVPSFRHSNQEARAGPTPWGEHRDNESVDGSSEQATELGAEPWQVTGPASSTGRGRGGGFGTAGGRGGYGRQQGRGRGGRYEGGARGGGYEPPRRQAYESGSRDGYNSNSREAYDGGRGEYEAGGRGGRGGYETSQRGRGGRGGYGSSDRGRSNSGRGYNGGRGGYSGSR